MTAADETVVLCCVWEKKFSVEKTRICACVCGGKVAHKAAGGNPSSFSFHGGP